ncbi:MAG: HAD hydrolase-like protein, partial [Candidatus Thermoplasmatota archaeon]|nr:HAD hydrolase-like protein [Candidatus Thermoplasmatota archaeon]
LSSVGRQFGHVGVFSTLKEAYEWSGNVYGSRNRLIEVQNEFEMEGLPGTVVPAGKAAARWRTAKGMRCAVLSLNTSSTIEKVVGSWGFYPIISVDKVNRVKPDPEGLFLALDALGCKPGEAVLIGNSDTDRRCAEAASVDHIDVSAIKEEWFQ